MALYRKEILPGVFYNHIKTDRFKSGYFSVNFLLPLSAESASYYALLPRVLCRGCARYPDQQKISRRLEELYGADISTHNTKRGELQCVSFSIDVLDNDYLPKGENVDILAETIELLRELLFAPYLTEDGHFLPEYVEGETRNCIDAVRSLINHKSKYATIRAYAEMCRYEAAGVSVDGRIEDYENLSEKKLLYYYQKMLKSARVEIYYVGRQEEEATEALAERLFLHAERECVLLPETQVIYRAGGVREVEETVAAAQGILTMGFRTGTVLQDEEYLAFLLFIRIFSASPASKLFMNVRERLSLCYFCYASLDGLKGTMLAVAGIKNENKETAKNEILVQLKEIVDGNITDDEMLCAKESLFNTYRAIYDNPVGVEAWYLTRACAGVLSTPEEAHKAIAALLREDVMAVAAKITLDTVYFLKGTVPAEEEEIEDEE
jgi:predicted Zn-dependent peptidase